MTSWEMLPAEIMADILARLPLAILMSLKVIFEQCSEQYCVIIKSQDFEKLQISYTAKNNRLSPLVFVAFMRQLQTKHNIQFPSSHCKWFWPNKDGCPDNRRIDSICDSLILIAAYTRRCLDVCPETQSLFYWNLATRESELSHPHFYGPKSCNSFCKELMIGYKVEYFKVVQFRGNDAIVYSSSTGIYKLLWHVIPRGSYLSAVHINGFLFWHGMSAYGDFILSFDINKEKFSEVKMPTPDINKYHFWRTKIWKLCVYGDDSFAVLIEGIPTLHEIDVWVMKIDSDSSEHTRNWTKIDTLNIHHFIPNYLQNSCPVCNRKYINLSPMDCFL